MSPVLHPPTRSHARPALTSRPLAARLCGVDQDVPTLVDRPRLSGPDERLLADVGLTWEDVSPGALFRRRDQV